ncbi:hypothetical protein AMATHDRAFT_4159 [Amanita thiersii Skay4041]|uniref:BTB domain-containing protein n=1 Tax=Amanita thiersii Skay4041 TaxID=703135 RepID=A0A2A9NRF2_9AGAR|nr:hypothetical protein AMATHDRAFT_4159 [Amanita thiersii Skay4041]
MSIDAATPFNSSTKADIILRSSDSVDFYALGPLLSIVSPVFDDMFSLNQAANQQETKKDGLPVVSLAEHSTILRFILLLIYPHVDEPNLFGSGLSRGVFINVCLAARKYCMDVIEGKLKKMLLTSPLIKEDPLRVFSIALHIGSDWDSVAMTAAQNSLSIQLKNLQFSPELGWITGGDLYQFLQWHCRRSPYWCSQDDISPIDRTRQSSILKQVAIQKIIKFKPENAAAPFDASANADMILRSSDMVDFFVFEGYLRVTSSVFNKMIPLEPVDGNLKDGMKVVSVTENSHTLRQLLLILYQSINAPDIASGTIYFEIGEAAKKYDLQFVQLKLRLSLHSSLLMANDPLRAFAIAMKFGWMDDARSTAVNTLTTPFRDLEYCSELEKITGADFFRLLEHRCKCIEVANDQVNKLYRGFSPPRVNTNDGRRCFLPPSYSFQSKFQEILKSRPRGSAILNDTNLDLDFLRAYQEKGNNTNILEGRRALAELVDEAVLKEPKQASESGWSTFVHEPMDVDILVEVAKAAQKYHMTEENKKLMKLLSISELLTEDPLRTFAIARKFEWKEVIKAAALNTLDIPIREFNLSDELQYISVADYHQLLQWRFECETIVDRVGGMELHGVVSNIRSRYIGLVRSKIRSTGCLRNTVIMNDDVLQDSIRGCTSFAEVIREYQGLNDLRKELATLIDTTIKQLRKMTQMYGMDVMDAKLQNQLLASRLVIQEPFHSYIITAQLRWGKVANLAVSKVVDTPLRTLSRVSELQGISGRDLYRFLKSRFEKEQSSCYALPRMNQKSTRPSMSLSNINAVPYITEAGKLFDSSAYADVIIYSGDSANFFVIKSLLGFVSPVFHNMLRSKTLRYLFMIIYHHHAESQLQYNSGSLMDVVVTARKYKMTGLEALLQKQISDSKLMVDDPYRAYAIAIKLGWNNIAKAATINTLRKPIKEMPDINEMNMITGCQLFRLLEFRFKCSGAA